MKPNLSLRVFAAVALTIALLCTLPGCAGKKQNVWGDTKSGLILEYRMEPGEMLKYQMVQEGVERVEVMGQTNESATSKTYVYTVEPRGMEGENRVLGITIDSMEGSLKTVQGEFSADAEPLIGKSFDLVLSPLGDEIDLSGAESLVYGVGPMGERSIMPDFQGAFNDLAGKPVKVGDSWTSTDTINVDEGNVALVIASMTVNRLDGYEKVEGLDCARVVGEINGTITGTGEQMGAPLVFDGGLTGTETWYFAYKQGYFVKSSADWTSDITVTVQAGQEMKVPVKATSSMRITLIK
jgi:hypothetical protein